LQKDSFSDVLADIQGKTIVEEPEMERVTLEHELKISSRVIRVPDRYVPSLHYLLPTDEGEPEPFDDTL